MMHLLRYAMPFRQPHVTLKTACDLLRLWRQRIMTRRHLAKFDERLLSDIGISPGQRIEELRKPFWR